MFFIMMVFKIHWLLLLLTLVSLVVTAHVAVVEDREKRNTVHLIGESYQPGKDVDRFKPQDSMLDNKESPETQIPTTRHSPQSGNVLDISTNADETVDTFGISDNPEDQDVVMHSSGHCPPPSNGRVFQRKSEANLEGIELKEGGSKHGDRFYCAPCNCSYTNKGYTIANCTDLHLSDLPNKLPNETWRLFLGHTVMDTFDVSKLLRYTQLSQLYVNHNKNLSRILFSTFGNSTTNITEMDFSSNKIKTIDDQAFIFMPKVRNLTLNNNKLCTITNLTFEGLNNLKSLNLSMNNLSEIEPGAFIQMKQLRTLDLSRNRKLGYSSKHFHPELFKPLQRLQGLYIQGNSHANESHYPHKVLLQLPNLKTLHIDGKKENFTSEMKKLKHFKILQLGYKYKTNCILEELKAYFFDNIPYIESLSLDNCHLHEVDSDAYCGAINLKKLSISHTSNYDLFTAFDDLVSLQHSSLKSLAFINLFKKRPYPFPCRYLSSNHSKYLKNIELEVMDLSENNLALLEDGFIYGMPRTLKQLILRRNRLTSVAILVTKIHFLTELTTLDLTDQSNFADNELHRLFEETTFCPHNQTSKTICSSPTSNVLATELEPTFSRDDMGFDDDIDTIDDFGKAFETDTDLTENLKETKYEGMPGKRKNLLIPPKLTNLIAPQFYRFGMVLFRRAVESPNSLQNIDFSDSLLSGLTNKDIMPAGITHANLAGNYFKSISHQFFQSNNSVLCLSMKNNLLGYEFAQDHNGSIFGNLSKTKVLDISLNMIFRLPWKFFIGLTGLEALSVSENKLQVLNTSFRHMKWLSHIDFSKNSITWIMPNTRDELDFLASSSAQIGLDLTKNPLPCTCSGLEIIYWMATTNVHFLNEDYLVCRQENGEVTGMKDLKGKLRYLQRHCATKSVIIISCIAAISVFIFLAIFATMYRFRWKMRYFRYIAMAKFVGFKPKRTRATGVKFDAYILYSDKSRRFVMRQCRQELEVKRGHRLCLADRDFMPGTYETQAIVSAVQNSSKTIAVVTPDFYEEEYSEYSVKMAIMEELFEKRSILHLCVYQPIPDEKMSKCHDLLMVMKRNDYTEFPPEDHVSDEVRQTFWDQLSRVIGHGAADETLLESDNHTEDARCILQ